MSEQGDMLGMPAGHDARELIDRQLELADVPEHKWAPLLAQMVDVIEAMHTRQGRGEEEAFSLACAAVTEIAEYLGGRTAYLPRGERLRIALRDAEIHHRWQRRATIEALASEYKISDIHIYRILRQQRALHIKKIQRELPFVNEGNSQ